jgi:hypothetical protein
MSTRAIDNIIIAYEKKIADLTEELDRHNKESWDTCDNEGRIITSIQISVWREAIAIAWGRKFDKEYGT